MSPSPLLFGRRDAVAFPDGYVTSPLSPLGQDFELLARGHSLNNISTEQGSTGLARSLPTSLKDLIAKPAAATERSTPMSSPSGTHPDESDRSSPYDVFARRVQAPSQLEEIAKELEELDVKVGFRDPFRTPSIKRNRTRTRSSNVSPNSVA